MRLRALLLSFVTMICVPAQANESGSVEYVLTQRAEVLKPSTGEVSVSMRSGTGVDGQSPESDVFGRIGLGRGLMLEVGGVRGLEASQFKPGIGMLWQFINSPHDTVGMTVGAQFRKGALSEPDGEGELDVVWEGTWALRSFEVSLNFLGGFDLDGDTTHLEGHAAVSHPVMKNASAGLEAESRWALRKSAVPEN